MKHYFIPDTQIKPGVPTEQLAWVGHDILARRPDKIIHIGDHWDFPSLSSYDKGKASMEGRRLKADLEVANEAFRLITEPTRRYNARCKPENRYEPEWHLTLGNHENRLLRAAESDPALADTLTLDLLDTEGWTIHGFLVPVNLDGVIYSHYFYAPMNGRPYGGQVATRLKTIGHSFSQGHQQTLDYAIRFVGGKAHHGLVAGAFYQHDEDYKGPQGNAHWRGVIVKHEVEDGHYDPMFLSLDYLRREYG